MKLKKGLIAVLITANVIMLVVGVFTIPPNLLCRQNEKTPQHRRKTADAIRCALCCPSCS